MEYLNVSGLENRDFPSGLLSNSESPGGNDVSTTCVDLSKKSEKETESVLLVGLSGCGLNYGVMNRIPAAE
jgi:hypothetical protein